MNQKRLVLIGIRRKGENGFQTKTDHKFAPKKELPVAETVIINGNRLPNASDIIRILPG